MKSTVFINFVNYQKLTHILTFVSPITFAAPTPKCTLCHLFGFHNTYFNFDRISALPWIHLFFEFPDSAAGQSNEWILSSRESNAASSIVILARTLVALWYWLCLYFSKSTRSDKKFKLSIFCVYTVSEQYGYFWLHLIIPAVRPMASWSTVILAFFHAYNGLKKSNASLYVTRATLHLP